MATRPARVSEKRKQLSCRTCGAGNRLDPSVIERGFQRCSHCDSVMAIEGVGSFAMESRAGGFTRVVSPGKSVFLLLLGRIVTLPGFLLLLIGGDVLSSLLRHVSRGLGVPVPLSWAPVAIFTCAMLVIFALLCTQQRLLVTENRVECWWRLFGVTVRHFRSGTHGLELEPRTGWWCGLLLRPRSGRSFLIRTEDSSEAELLRRDLEEAIEEARISIAADALPCPGCGAAIATALQVIRAGGVECSHCGAGLLATEGSVVLGEATLSLAMVPLERRPRTDRRRSPNALECRLHAELFARPFTALGMMIAGLGCGGAMAAGGVAILIGAEQLRSFGLIFALLLVPGGLAGIVYMFISALGKQQVRLDESVLELETRLGPVRVAHRVVPLARLLGLDAKVGPGSVGVKLKTALEELKFELVLLNGEGAVVIEELIAELAERLRAMERQVSIHRTNVVPPPQLG